MANEFSLPTNETGLSAFGLLKNSSGKFWNGSTFVTYASGSFSGYPRTVTEAGSSGIYNCDMPATITDAGRYEVFFYDKGDDNAAGEGDRFIGSAAIQWDGAAVSSGQNELVNSLISLEEAKNYLKITSLAEDEILRNLLNEISALIQSYTKRNLLLTTHTEYYSGDGSNEMQLRHYPIVSITSILMDELRQFTTATPVDLTNNVIIKKQSGIIRAFNLLYGWTCGESNIQVIYSAGYSSDYVGGTMPFDIRLAVKRLLDIHFRLGYTQRKLDNVSESLSGMNVTFKDFDLPKDVKLILGKYCKNLPAPQYEYAD